MLPPPTPHRASRALRHVAMPLLAGGLAFAAYALTLPAGLTWAHDGADGGDLLAAALTGGVPHPTGYPTYQLALRLLLGLAPGNPARLAAWFSAACAALAVALLADLARRQLEHGRPAPSLTACLAAFIAAVSWAVCTLLWGQATIVEVYALHALFCMALLWLARRWLDAATSSGRAAPWAIAAGLVLGAGLGNHLTLSLMLPGIAVLAWSERGRLVRGWWKALLPALGAVLAGLLVYAYLPVAGAHRAPVNWGDPETLPNFLWLVTGRLYARLPFGLNLPQLASRLYRLVVLLVEQYSPWGLLLALLGLWRLDRRLHPWWRATLLTFLAFTVYTAGYASSDALIYMIPALAMMALWLAEGLQWVFALARPRPALYAAVVLLAAAALPVASLVDNWGAQDLSHDTQATGFISSALAEAEPNAVIVVLKDERTFALWYAVYGLRQRPDVVVFNPTLYGYDWYRRSLAETHPDLLPSVDPVSKVSALIATWSQQRPVYVAEEIPLPLQLEEAPPGAVLKRVTGLAP